MRRPLRAAAAVALLTLAAAATAAADEQVPAHPEFEAARRALFGPAPAERVRAAALAATSVAASEPACALASPGSDAATTESCLACHPLRAMHPVGRYRQGPELRAPEEVVRRGVLLPGGRIACVTCHDRRSPWKDHLALPPGSRALPAVVPGDPATYEGRPSWRFPGPATLPPPPGSAVSPAPLCAACHTQAD